MDKRWEKTKDGNEEMSGRENQLRRTRKPCDGWTKITSQKGSNEIELQGFFRGKTWKTKIILSSMIITVPDNQASFVSGVLSHHPGLFPRRKKRIENSFIRWCNSSVHFLEHPGRVTQSNGSDLKTCPRLCITGKPPDDGVEDCTLPVNLSDVIQESRKLK